VKLSICRSCGEMLHFEHSACLECGAPQGFLPGDMHLTSVVPQPDGTLEAASRPEERWRPCANAEGALCNWLVPADGNDEFCLGCRLNRTIPDLSVPGHLALWRDVEAAKRRLVYAMLRFGLLTVSWRDDPARGLSFDFLADTEDERFLTGHAGGLITVNIAEADSVERERRRVALREPLRTMLGHLRHEVAHYYWDILVRDKDRLGTSRRVFGDESADYSEALRAYYRNGAPPDWQENHVSEYATAHPWEDFAETWTHYLHLVDTLDTAASFGIAVQPTVSSHRRFAARVPDDPYQCRFVSDLVKPWRPLTTAVNGLNRSMGQPDLYPFALSSTVVEKLGVIHMLVRATRPDDLEPPA